MKSQSKDILTESERALGTISFSLDVLTPQDLSSVRNEIIRLTGYTISQTQDCRLIKFSLKAYLKDLYDKKPETLIKVGHFIDTLVRERLKRE